MGKLQELQYKTDLAIRRAVDRFTDRVIDLGNKLGPVIDKGVNWAIKEMDTRSDKATELIDGRLILVPSEELSAKSKINLRGCQRDIQNITRLHLEKKKLINYVEDGLLDQSSTTSEDNGFDQDLLFVMSRVAISDEIAGEKFKRWGYATAALTLFDETKRKKMNENECRLEMRKMIIEGGKNENDIYGANQREIANKVAGIKNREELIEALQQYIG